VTHRPLIARSLAAAAALLCISVLSPGTARAAADTKAFENPTFRYGVALPSGCRHEEGPGTLDAVCSSDLDAERSKEVSAASALVLEVGAETVPADGGTAAAELAQRYGETQFKEELAEAVCGESDRAKVKIDSPQQVLEEARVVYTAGVVCPEIKFLGLGERRAQVRFTITPGMRYRVMARALKDDFDKRKEVVDAFFASFKILP
jgi:uncharacterized membrane protein